MRLKILLVVLGTLLLAAPADAHQNQTVSGYAAALRSCERNYAPHCDIYGVGAGGDHSYKLYMQWTAWWSRSVTCHASYTVGHDQQVWEHHATYCGTPVAKRLSAVPGFFRTDARRVLGPRGSPLAGTEAITTNCRTGTVTVTLDRQRHRQVINHMRRAWAKGWPRVLVINREGADQRRDRLLKDVPTRPGDDRDEYPPAVLRENVRADVEYVIARQNRSAGAVMGNTISPRRGRKWCDGARVRWAFRTRPTLRTLATRRGVEHRAKDRKADLIAKIVAAGTPS